MKNKEGRRLLEERYGKGCFMERAGIRIITPEEEEKMRLKGFKRLNRQITYHHIKEKHLGGKVTIENGANLAYYNHEWLHRQPPEIKAAINQRLQDFKLSIDLANLSPSEKGIEIKTPKRVDFEIDESSYISIPVYDGLEPDIVKPKVKFNRAKNKREMQEIIDEELYR